MIGQARTTLSTSLVASALRVREKELNLFHEVADITFIRLISQPCLRFESTSTHRRDPELKSLTESGLGLGAAFIAESAYEVTSATHE